MTAEIGILNRMGVALAADSAVTVSNKGAQKVYNSANKLFSLSKYHPVGIMVYGGANFMGVPWEIIIKSFREQLGENTKGELNDYCAEFINFVQTDSRLVNSDSEKNRVKSIFSNYILECLTYVGNLLKDQLAHGIQPDPTVVDEWLKDKVNQNTIEIMQLSFIEGFDQSFIDEFKIRHIDTVKEVISVFIDFNISNETEEKIIEYAAQLIGRDVFSDNYSGIVIAGYGDTELFPTLIEYHIDGIFCGKLKKKLADSVVIAAENGQNGEMTASIKAFAQREMVYSFLTGVDPFLRSSINDVMHTIFQELPDILQTNLAATIDDNDKLYISSIGEQLLAYFNEEIDKVQSKRYIKPVYEIVNILPKEDLAEMAEALVNLTSFKRRVSIDAETVGGPIDVAVITKGDGLVWIKRKHYFKPELNYHFFQNYLRGENND
jgi:hypothetical protein